MRVECIGGGPAGLYFALLTKKAHPRREVVVRERNKPLDTFGFGVVFSDATLERLARADRASHDAITERFYHWDDIDVWIDTERGPVRHRSRGHGFSGISRRTLIEILTKRAVELGVDVRFEDDAPPGRAIEADLVVIADGVNSAHRDHDASTFGPHIDVRPNRFVWLGTTFPFEAFTFYFKKTPHGLFQVHAYRYEEGSSTFIVECSNDAFLRSGLREDDEDATIAYFEEVFAAELAGHRLLKNRSRWRQFPVIRNERWHTDNRVLIGDAAHTAHYSIGSGTKLAMEDAIALREQLDAHVGADPAESLRAGLAAYEKERRPVVESIQRAAQVSLEWFENTERAMRHDPLTFTFSLLTRSLRVTHENLAKRDPAFVEEVDRAFERASEAETRQLLPPRADHKTTPRPPMFTPLRLRDLVLPNRVGVSSMCMYSAKDGTIDDFHLVHLGSRAIGGAGLVMTEMTNVSADGRITPGCAGLYTEEHARAWKRVTAFIHAHSPAKVGMQIGHAGRKGSTKEPWFGMDVPMDPADHPWALLGPSPIPWSPAHLTPREMTEEDMERVKGDFVRSVELAKEAAFDLIELHAAHGYLLATFLSPLTNHRSDAYGGSIENRLRFPLDVFRAMRSAWPAHKPTSVRVSATDWARGGTTITDLLAIARAFRDAGCDIIDVSGGSTVPDQKPAYGRLYQVPFSDVVRNEANIPTMTVGNISSYTDVNGVLAARRADVCLIARGHLFDPYWTRHAAQAQGYTLPWPDPYGVMAFYNPR
ncbi:MAG: FAD-dependent monooxygenase [Polyangiaceae bacterium]